MKKFFLLLFASIFLLTGCNKNLPEIYFSSVPIARTSYVPEINFNSGQRIYFILVNPKGFYNDIVRIQVVKQKSEVSDYGYSIEYANDVQIDSKQLFMTDYITLSSGGLYMLRIFNSNNYEKPIAQKVFKVTQ